MAGMRFMSTVTSKGQTTVPKAVRRHLGLGPRQKIIFLVEPDGVKIKAAGSRISDLAGILGGQPAGLTKAEERVAYRQARAARYQG
jgi:AbrB family looped-hinge helix DNA binding protein